MKTFFKRKLAYLSILAIIFNLFSSILFVNESYAVAGVSGQIDNATDTFVSSLGSVGLSNLDVGGVYTLMSGSTVVSSGALIASNSTGSLELNPSFYVDYGNYNLTLSGSFSGATTSDIVTKSFFIGPVDYQDLYVNQVAPTLLGSGVTTNLGDVTYANVQSFSGLYFEEAGMGKIYFSNSLDLTNSGTISFLQDLPNKLNITDGNINFDPNSSDFSNFGAQLYMYFNTGSTFIAGISNPDSFVIRSSTGQIIDSSGVLSNIHGACGVGDPFCILVFDTAHFTSFDLKPLLTDVNILSDNTNSGSLAKLGNQLTLSFTGSESLTGVNVTFNGVPANSTNGSGTVWSAISDSVSTGNGIVNFSIDYSDLTGNTGTTVTGTTDLSSVSIDIVNPVINSKQVKNITETGATLEFTYTETNFSNQSGSVFVTDNASFTGTYGINFSGNIGTSSLNSLTGSTNYDYTLSLIDDAGNTTSTTGSFSTPTTVTGTGNITETGSVSLGFTGNLAEGNNYDLSGTNLIINSNPNDSGYLSGSLTLSGITIITSSGSWNGILLAPTLIDINSTDSATGSEVGTGVTIIETIKTGAEGNSLTSSGGYFNVSFIVSGYASGTIFNLYRSDNGSTWQLNTPDNTCTLDINSMCNFRTDHLSFFAPGFDTAPDAFSFTAQTNKELSTSYESNTITISGISTGSTITIVGGEYKIGNGSYTSATGTVTNGDTVTVRLTSSSSYNTQTTATLTILGVSAGFNVTTKQQTSGGSSSGGGTGGSSTTIITPNQGVSKYVYNNSKLNDFELKIDKMIIQKNKQNNLVVLELRNKLMQELEKYIELLKSGTNAEIINSKKIILQLSKNLTQELNNKLYNSKNGVVFKFAKNLDKKISKKISNQSSIVWQYRNRLLEILDYLITNKASLSTQDRFNLINEIRLVYKNILNEL